MSLLSPFFAQPHLPRTNLGQMLQGWVAGLDDAGVLAWADGMDWSEPVLSVRRFQSSSSMGWQEGSLSARSLAEVVVLTGDERLVGLLLHKDRFPEMFRFSGVQLKGTEYETVDIPMSLANAAIQTGNPNILRLVLEAVIDQRTQPNHWMDGGRFSPAVCLASQRHAPGNLLQAMWGQMEEALCAHLDAQWGKGLTNTYLPRMRAELLSHACRLGNSGLVEALVEKFKLPLSFSKWDDLLHMGEIRWCTEWSTRHNSWARTEDGEHRKPDRSPPAVLLVRSAIEQQRKIPETFAGELAEAPLREARANLSHVLAATVSAVDGKSLLSLSRDDVSMHLGPPLVEHDPELAQGWLDAHHMPLSVQEAIAWLAQPDGVERIHSRSACGIVACQPEEASTWLEKRLAKEEWNAVGASCVGRLWKMLDLVERWPVSERQKAEVRGLMIDEGTAPAAHPGRARRM